MNHPIVVLIFTIAIVARKSDRSFIGKK